MKADIQHKVETFFSAYPKRSYPKGQILIFADETPDQVFYLLRGKVRKYDVSYRGDEIIVNIFRSPSFFPRSTAINHTPNKYFYKTEEETEAFVAPGVDAVRFLQDNPDVMYDLLSRLYNGMEGVFERLVHLMSGTAKSRLLHELLIECRRFGRQKTGDTYLLTASETDLAARSGLSRETVSREMRKLKTQGLVTVSHEGIVVTNLDKLRMMHGSQV